jgi:hypothetical protein
MTAHVAVTDSGKHVQVLCPACKLEEEHGRNYPEALSAAGQHNTASHPLIRPELLPVS